MGESPFRLQVWNLFVKGEQIMRTADCKKLAEKPKFFRQAQAVVMQRLFVCSVRSRPTLLLYPARLQAG